MTQPPNRMDLTSEVKTMGLKAKINKWLEELVDKLTAWLDKLDTEMDEIEAVYNGETVEQAQDKQENGSSSSSLASSKYPLGIASCWHGSNASERMMNILSPRMSDDTFGKRLAWMVGKGCTAAHLILVNAADGEAGGYAAWNDSDREKMKQRWETVKKAGLTPIPWIITDDSKAYRDQLFANADKLVGKMADFLAAECPYVVLGLEMDEDKSVTAEQWKKVRDAVKKHYKGPLGVHHCSGNSFKFASLGEIVLGQLDPGCSESQVQAQIKAILAKGKRAVGFEYERGPSRKLAVAALKAGAEGCGNWDGGDLPGVANSATTTSSTLATTTTTETSAEDAVDFSSLNFCWGGFKGGGAKLDSKARIYNLSVSSSGMSYKWLSGGCENLGASSSSDASCLACLFCLIDGSWKGGKFDWISTSRTTRDFENVKGAYGGWDKSAISKASKFAFVIISKDGKKRTNVIAR